MSGKLLTVGFTGTSTPTTLEQKRTLFSLIKKWWYEVEFWVHGDCINADADFHGIVKYLNGKIIIHPPVNSLKRAFCQGSIHIMEPKSYLERNKDIVKSANRLIAVPKSDTEELRSGTWATVRYARKKGILIYIIYQNGRLVVEQNWP